MKPLDDSGPSVEGEFGLNMDFADASVGGGDVFDNFDFDSFLNTDDGGMGFDFPDFDGGLKDDDVGSVLDHTSHAQKDTENAQQHSQKRSHLDAFPGSPEDTPISQCRKRRKSPVGTTELFTDRENDEVPNDSLLGVEALLQRWFDASAASLLLRSSDG